MRNAESRMNYAMNNSGGLSGAQKYLGRIANYNNLYNSIANMYSGMQQQNNAYRTAAANAKLEAGAKYAANRMAARRADDEVYMRSHAAR
jgi:predicted phage-related endonuclease